MLFVRLLQVRAYPRAKRPTDLWEWIFLRHLDGAELGESDAESHIFYIVLGNHVVPCRWERWEGQEFEKSLACEAPALLVFVGKGLRVGERLGEGDHRGLAVKGPCQLLRFRKDDGEVNGGKDTVRKLEVDYSNKEPTRLTLTERSR